MRSLASDLQALSITPPALKDAANPSLGNNSPGASGAKRAHSEKEAAPTATESASKTNNGAE